MKQWRDPQRFRIIVYLVHLPFAMNPNGNHPVFPTTSEGIREIDYEWKLTDTWKQMETLTKKGCVQL